MKRPADVEEIDAYVRRVVAAAPPLTEEQRACLASIFGQKRNAGVAASGTAKGGAIRREGGIGACWHTRYGTT
jgi:hypothetical protein